MSVSGLTIHLPESKVPRFVLQAYNSPSSFTTIKIVSDDTSTILFFVDSLQDVVNFKNACLWACERHIKEQTS